MLTLPDLATSHHAAAVRARLARLDPWRAAEAMAMSEVDFAGRIRGLVRVRPRLWAYHTHDSRRSDKGFLDETILGGWVKFWELKTEIGKVTPEQLNVIGRLLAAGADVAVMRPSDLMSGLIERELDALHQAVRPASFLDINPYTED